jgi:hypothetical protein
LSTVRGAAHYRESHIAAYADRDMRVNQFLPRFRVQRTLLEIFWEYV